jgi:hypothetical protein
MHPDLSLARVLPKVTAGTAVALGLLMLAAGLGLGFALLTSAQPPLQFATAAVLLVTGAVKLASNRGLWKENLRCARIPSALDLGSGLTRCTPEPQRPQRTQRL